MDVGSIMSPLPVTLSPQDTLDRATEEMDAHGVRHLPVVENGRLVGLVADRDLLAGTGWRAGRDGQPPERISNDHRRRLLSEVMHPPTVRLTTEDPAVAAARDIARHRVGCTAVEREGVLIGIVTELDVLQVFVETPGAREQRCADLMIRELATLARDRTIGEAVGIFEREGIHHAPVLDGEELVGMLSDRDLARAAGRGARPDSPLGDWMTPQPFTIEAAEPLAAAARLMVEEKISALPVVEGRTLAGLLSMTDLLVRAQEQFEG